MTITSINFGIKEVIVSPYNEDIQKCLRIGLILSSLIFKIMIDEINPIVNVQKTIWIDDLKNRIDIIWVTDCNQ